jgi:hypothetical protein
VDRQLFPGYAFRGTRSSARIRELFPTNYFKGVFRWIFPREQGTNTDYEKIGGSECLTRSH